MKWIDESSAFKPTIWAALDRLLDVADQIDERLKRIKPRANHLNTLRESPKHLVFFLADLVRIVEPTHFEVINYFYRELVGRADSAELRTYLELGCAMALLRKLKDAARTDEYWATPPLSDATTTFHRPRTADVRHERAAHLSVLQLIPEATRALETFAGC